MNNAAFLDFVFIIVIQQDEDCLALLCRKKILIFFFVVRLYVAYRPSSSTMKTFYLYLTKSLLEAYCFSCDENVWSRGPTCVTYELFYCNFSCDENVRAFQTAYVTCQLLYIIYYIIISIQFSYLLCQCAYKILLG